ncbi:MAG: fused signal recognition particle receptor, partial [Marinobacter maritimus]
MAKKKGLFSWFGKKSTEETDQDEKDALLEADRLEAERSAVEQLKDLKLKAKRLAAEQLAAEQLAAEQFAAEQLAAEQLAAEQLAAEQFAAEQFAAEQLAAEQFAAEQLAAGKPFSEKPNKEEKTLGFFARFKQSLTKTRLSIGSGLYSLFSGKKIDADLFEELEEQLILADIGVDTTLKIIDKLTAQANRKQLKDAEALYTLLKEDLSGILQEVEQPLVIDETKSPYVILMVGVNGVGKTTTIGKLAKKYQQQGKSVMLAAGDTFRAA